MIKVKIEVSARHCHISQRHLAILFGKGYTLTELKPLSQTGQYAAQETVTVQAKDGRIDNVRILGPVRYASQIEISRTDARKLKLEPPVRLSEEIAETPSATIIGPRGSVRIKDGVIIAKRHIHCDPVTAKKYGLKNDQKVAIRTFGERASILEETIVRVHEDFVLYAHLDTDEGNATLPDGACGVGELIIKK